MRFSEGQRRCVTDAPYEGRARGLPRRLAQGLLVLGLGGGVIAACTAVEDPSAGGTPGTEAQLLPGPADAEMLEACVLENAFSDRTGDCIGLWSDGCVAEGRDPNRCAHLESRLWTRVLLDAVPEDRDLPYPAIQKAIAECERAGGPPGRCERDGTAALAIPALLDAEAG